MEVARIVYRKNQAPKEQFRESAVRSLISETQRILDNAVEGVLTENSSMTLRYALKYHARMFSGYKTYRSLREMSAAVFADKEGKVKRSESDFLSEAEKLNKTYNHNYLYAERNQAAAAAQMADKWQDIERDGDKYNLQYRTANDEKVREEHALLHGITLPPSDPFWDKYYPPNGWNCRCTAVQVRKEKYPTSDPNDAMSKGERCTPGKSGGIFRYNIGKTMELFPRGHNYYRASDEVKDATNGYIREDWTAKTIAEAERFIANKFGVRCDLAGFADNDMKQVGEFFRSMEENFQYFPELKKVMNFIGTHKGRVKLLEKAKREILKKDNPKLSDEERALRALIWADNEDMTHVYAYSDAEPKNMGLNGVCFNSDYKGKFLYQLLEEDIDIKDVPAGCSSMRYLIGHEFGHRIDELLGIRSNPKFLRIYNETMAKGDDYVKDNLCNNANTSVGEFVAEAYGEYVGNRRPRPIAAAVGELTKEIYGETFQSKQ